MLYARKMDWKINDLFFDSDKRPMNFQGHIFLPYYRTTYSSAVVRGKENAFIFIFRFDSINEKQQKSGLKKILDRAFFHANIHEIVGHLISIFWNNTSDLFVTSKNETTNSPIHELKVLQNVF